MANRLSELMAEKDRGAKAAENWLTRSFRDMLADLGIDERKLHSLALTYLRNRAKQLAAPGAVLDESKILNDKGNLKKEMEKDLFTIKVYHKLVAMLRPEEFTVTVKARWHDGYELNNGKGFVYKPLDLDNIDDEISDDMIDDAFIDSWNKVMREKGETFEGIDSTVEQSFVSKHDVIPETKDVN